MLTFRDVTDAPAWFVADPFMIRRNDQWAMYFEVFRADTRRGEIGLATSRDGRTWAYREIVLREPFHLSFPRLSLERSGVHDSRDPRAA